MKTKPVVIWLVLSLMYVASAHGQQAKPEEVEVWGIDPCCSQENLSYVEHFTLTINPAAKDAKGKVVVKKKGVFGLGGQSYGGGLLVVGTEVFVSLHRPDPKVYKTGLNGGKFDEVFDALTVSGDDGFKQGLTDISGDANHLWINPYDNSGQVFEFVFDQTNGTWAVGKKWKLANASDKYDGMEFFADAANNKHWIYANRVDAGFSITNAKPPNDKPCRKAVKNAIYDRYDADTGNLDTAGFIKASFEGSGIAFNGKYFFVSEICNNKIAVYDETPDEKTGRKLIGEVNLGGALASRKSLCVNPKLTRCLEDLSIEVSPGAGTSSSLGPRSLAILRLEPNPVKVSQSAILSVVLKSDGLGIPGATVMFTASLGDVRFEGGDLSNDGKVAVLHTDENGEAIMTFVAGQPGLSMIHIAADRVTLDVSVSATNIAPQ